MKQIMYVVYIIVLAFSFVAVAYAQSDSATSHVLKDQGGGDVYNFYFQKAPGPVNINQGSAGQASAGTPPAAVVSNPESSQQPSAQVQATAPSAATAPPGFKRWTLNLGWASGGLGNEEKGKSSYSGAGIGFGYNVNRYVGLYGTVSYADTVAFENKAAYGGHESYKRKNPIDGSIGIQVMPVHINTFGYDLFEFGFVAGAMTNTREYELSYYDGYNNGSGWIYRYGDEVGERKFIAGYGGLRAGIWFDPSLGIVGEYRKTFDAYSNYQANVSLAFKL